MTFYELYKKLSERYPDSYRCDWDNDGIMCANNLEQPVKKVLLALDVTMDTVKYAIDNGFDTVISHHPLVFRSQKSLNPLNYTQKKLIELIRNNVNVMSFHTRLDAASNGVNDVLCNVLKIENVSIDPDDNIGRIGYVSKKCEISAFAENIKRTLDAPFVLYTGNKTVNKVYVVGGDGKDLIENAIKSGCDTLITGRASYNTAIDACDMGLNIVEAGHFFTENPVCYELEKQVKGIVQDVLTEVYNSNKILVI